MSKQVDPARGHRSPTQALLDELARRGEVELPSIGQTTLRVPWTQVDAEQLERRLSARGLRAPEVLAERALAGLDLDAEAESLGITRDHVLALHHAALEALPADVRRDLEKAVAHPKGEGQLPPDDPETLALLDGLKPAERLVSIREIQRWVLEDFPWAKLPRGPLNAVDHRPKFGPARNQGGRPTCTSFAATAVVEGLEALRDARPQPRDLSEEFLWWYSKEGAKITAGGYDCRAALHHYATYGSCLERLLPYWTTQLGSNHAHVPVPDAAIDRARDYRQPPYASLPARDVAALKEVLRSGRCAGVVSGVHGWSTGTGVISFPEPLDSKGIGSSHCTTAIGFIDRDDLPEHYEGGYFIIRNSWGGANSSAHLMGPEYGGHLLMPYGWYRRYTWGAATLGQLEDPTEAEQGRTWRAEYFRNRSLRGVPAKVEYVPDVDFDWGTSGPFSVTIDLPFIGEIEIFPGQSNDFSARFTGIRRLREGWYRFALRGDDGVRLWIDDRLVINGWRNQPATQYTAEHFVTGGDHVLRVEYYEASGVASIELDVQAIEFQYELFANTELSGAPAATFQDTLSDLEWRHAAPVASFLNGKFSLRGTADLQFAAGSYRFHARHTGGCRIRIDGVLVLDDWDGDAGSGAPVTLTAGTKTVVVEFRNLATYPAAGEKDYYRAALAFEWSEEAWHAELHEDLARRDIRDAGWPDVDSIYEAFVTQSLTGQPALVTSYSTTRPAGATYSIVDASDTYRLSFGNLAAFGAGIPGGGALPADGHYLSVHLHRRLHLAASGRYLVKLRADEAFRVMIDGSQVMEQRYGGSDAYSAEVELTAGVHDVAIEYANTRYGGKVLFDLEPVAWTVDYYDGKDLAVYQGSETLDDLGGLVEARPATVGSTSWSARAKRTLWLPVGRYRVYVRVDDGVRVRVGGSPLIDAWTDQAARGYAAHIEHRGGTLPVEVEYYQAGGGASFDFDLSSDGFLAEYYEGVDLNNPPGEEGWERNVPVAYRFEPVVDFDWGSSGRLARVGADRFSARFWGAVELPVGRWRFRVTSDDGVRLFLDDRLLLDQWRDQSATERSATIDLPEGRREVRLEYYERTGAAVCKLELERVY